MEDCGWVYPVPVVRVNSRFVDKFFLSDYFFTLAEERARFTSVKKKKRNKKRNASRRFHGRFDEVRQAHTSRHFTQADEKTHKTIKEMKQLSSASSCLFFSLKRKSNVTRPSAEFGPRENKHYRASVTPHG